MNRHGLKYAQSQQGGMMQTFRVWHAPEFKKLNVYAPSFVWTGIDRESAAKAFAQKKLSKGNHARAKHKLIVFDGFHFETYLVTPHRTLDFDVHHISRLTGRD